MYNKIINPENGKIVGINTKAGKKILQNYIKMSTGGELDETEWRFERIEHETQRRFERIEHETQRRFERIEGYLERITDAHAQNEEYTDYRFDTLVKHLEGIRDAIHDSSSELGDRILQNK